MSRKKLGGSFWIVRNLGFERIVKLRGLYWIGGNLEGRFGSPKPWILTHCETSGCKLERAETWHLCT